MSYKCDQCGKFTRMLWSVWNSASYSVEMEICTACQRKRDS